MPSQPRPLIVIPTYDERESLPTAIAALDALDESLDILVVDDGSPDGTGVWAEALAGERDDVHVLHRTEKSGLGGAYLAGFAWALDRGYEIICEMDADGSHRARDLPLLLAAVRDGADLAIGSRWVPGGAVVDWPARREALSRGANAWIGLVMGLGVRDATAGFRAFRASTLRAIDLSGVESKGFSFQIDMTRRVVEAGLSIAEVPIVFVERQVGESKMSGSIISEALGRTSRWGWERRRAQLGRLLRRG